jgi:dipeptidyl aminopeptidase/acylaminoacyl peptidase
MIPLIPRDLLFGNPSRVAPQLSPDGLRLAYIAPDEGVLNVWVRTIGQEDDRPVTRDRDRGVRDYAWAEDNVHLLYVQDKAGDENWHVYKVTEAGGDDVDLTPIDDVQARIVAVDRRHPNTILVAVNDRDPQLHDVYRVDLTTGERTLAIRNEIGAIDWTADHEQRIRCATLPTPEGGFLVLHRSGEDGEWAELLTFAADDAMASNVFGFAGDDVTLYFTSCEGVNAGELRAMNTGTGEVTVLAGDPDSDVEDVLTHPDTHVPQAVIFYKERKVVRVLDEAIRADLEKLEALVDGDLHVIDRDREDRQWLVAHTRDLGAVVYHAFDRETGEASFLFSARPDLDDQPLVPMNPVSFTARDGLTIHGYLSLPAGVEPKGLPTVLNIHGGPWHRDVWGLHPEAQWLANRGYACLQVNFRGSTGYGKEFVNAGDREWGGKMQDDITDAVKWLIERGIADPDRTAIYGGSYGGYAVLSGLTKTPELFACGVDIVGPSNLITFSNTIPPYWEPLRALFVRRVGDVETEEDFLKSRSPLFMVDRIEAPLLIVQGRNDPRVNRDESIQIRDALQARGKTVQFLEFDDEGHGFAKPENRMVFYAKAERFLADHLGGRFEE